MQGMIKCFNEKKYYGFIQGCDNKDYFFHISDANFIPQKGQEVKFEVGADNKSREKAVRISIASKAGINGKSE